MRILVYGAGVIGANLAADLYASGRDITLLARGKWAETLEQKGLVIDPVFSPCKRKYRIPVIRELKADDVYDVIFVVMRYTQLEQIVPVLAANATKNIVFVGNNLSAEALVEKLPGHNILFGFYMAAGHREKDCVVSISLRKITIGQLKGAPSNETLIREIFEGTKIKAVYQPNMGDYLLCHAAFVLPVGFACYFCGGDLKKIKNDRAYLNRIIDANIEGYSAIEHAGHEILPASDKDYHSEKYRRLCYRVYKIMCATVIGKVCASDHALNAADRNPYSWNMEFLPYPDGSGYEARFSKCGICTLMGELGLADLTPAMCRLDYTMSDAGGTTDFVRKYTLASGGPYCDCGYKKKDLT